MPVILLLFIVVWGTVAIWSFIYHKPAAQQAKQRFQFKQWFKSKNAASRKQMRILFLSLAAIMLLIASLIDSASEYSLDSMNFWYIGVLFFCNTWILVPLLGT